MSKTKKTKKQQIENILLNIYTQNNPQKAIDLIIKLFKENKK